MFGLVRDVCKFHLEPRASELKAHKFNKIEVSLCRACALVATASRWKITIGGSLPGIVRGSLIGGVQRVTASAIEGSEQGLSHTRHCGSSRSESISSACCAARNVRQLDQLAEAPHRISRKTATALLKILFKSLLEQSRKGIIDGLRKFIEVDNHEAVKVAWRHKILHGGGRCGRAYISSA